MTDRARIAAIATAVPEHVPYQAEVIERAREFFAPDVPGFKRFTDAYRNAAIKTRHSCVPIEWYGQEHAFSERNALYIENAVARLTEVSEDLLHRSRLSAADIDALEEVYDQAPVELVATREVLPRNGNMSAATALFVLADTMEEGVSGN